MTPEEYKAKKEAKIERYKELSEKNQTLADSMLKQASTMQSVIPMGQPILVGHHSERADRNYRNKIENKVRKAFETGDKADYYAEKARRAENNRAIFADDPEAGEKLADKIERLQKQQKAMLQANRIIRSTKSDEEKVIALTDMGFSEAYARSLLVPDFANRRGFPAFRLTNNNANISRLKKRLGSIQEKADEETTEETINGVRIVENTDENRIQLFFPAIPAPIIRGQLKANGFRWSPTSQAWQRHRSNYATYIAHEIVKKSAQ